MKNGFYILLLNPMSFSGVVYLISRIVQNFKFESEYLLQKILYTL